MSTLFEQIAQVHADNIAIQETVDEQIRSQRAEDQSRIAKIVIWTFVCGVIGIFVLVLVTLLITKGGPEWKDPAEFLSGVISSVLLPVVTLVLGYYFGKEKNG